MSEPVRPEEAARALAEIDARHQQMVDVATIPTWFWWSVGLLMVVFSAAVDTRRPVIVGIATPLFVIAILAAVGRLIAGALRRAQVRNDLLGPRAVLAILGFVAIVLAVGLPTAFLLDAAKVAHPALIGVTAAAAVLVVGGPMLSRYLRRIMVANRSSEPR